MKDIRTAILKHKKMVCILGLLFVILLECCVFPVGSITHTEWFTIGIINLITAVGICKCVGEMEAALFPKASGVMIIMILLSTVFWMQSKRSAEF